MFRLIQNDLVFWKDKADRKPLLLRGARQIGKSYSVRTFGQSQFDNIVEINFERYPEHGDFFLERSPKKIIQLLEVATGQVIVPGKTLLFLDEIQAAPQALPMLRYFYEDVPELHVIAAGSLLEFVLSEHDFAMPVGRVEFLHMGPLSFAEFVLAKYGQKRFDYLKTVSLADGIPDALHLQFMTALKEYALVGGMPEAVKKWLETESWSVCDAVKHNLLSAFQSDFAKYRKRVPYERLVACLRRVPAVIGERVKFVNIDEHEKAKNVAAALGLLEMAQVIHRVFHTAAGGVPLAAEINRKIFKVLFLDVGLVSALNGLSLTHFQTDLMLVNQGKVSEQLVGQELLSSFPSYQKPELHFWTRDKKNAAAELDYVVSLNDRVIPVEVKSGKTGTLKSLALFCQEKNKALALRFNGDKPSVFKTSYALVSLPLYLAGEWRRFLSQVKL